MNAIETIETTSPQVEAFKPLELSGAPLWPLRKAGLARFAGQGYPSQRDEDWRFTNIRQLKDLPFLPLLTDPETSLDQGDLKAEVFGPLDTERLVFVDGHFSESLSEIAPAQNGIRIGSLARELERDASELEHKIGSQTIHGDNPFNALNDAFFIDGAFIQAPANQESAKPIHLLFVSTGQVTGATAHIRNLIIAEPGSRLTVIESHISLGEAAAVTNCVTETLAGRNTQLEHVKLQDQSQAAFHFSAAHARLEGNALYAFHSISVGARLARHNLRMNLAGEGAECLLNGLYLTQGQQLTDHHMIVEHASPNCDSHEYFNGLLDDQSRGVFHGRILVHPGAQKTDAKQTNKNLLLSDDATANTKPQLEIYADDVKCTHGATVGELDGEAIFYLRSRGIDESAARRMLMHAFGGEIIDRIQNDVVRDVLDSLVQKRLEAHHHLD